MAPKPSKSAPDDQPTQSENLGGAFDSLGETTDQNPPSIDRSPPKTTPVCDATPELDTLPTDEIPSDSTGGSLHNGHWPPIEGFHILAELGRGGMGRVYQARQLNLDRLVALKVVLSSNEAPWNDDEAPELAKRFLKEAEAVAALSHRNIVQIFQMGQQNHRPFFTMEYVAGGSLADKIGEQMLGIREAVQLIATLAEAMEYAHLRGIVHRDLKPANILLATDNTPKITDFGLAKHWRRESDLTAPDALIGTPGYMSPEQASGQADQATPAVDIYALGVMLFELLTGSRPFHGKNHLEVLRKIREEEPLPPASLRPKLPRDLQTICLKCLRKNPKDRYAFAQELADDLRRYHSGRPIRARQTPPWERMVKSVRRRPAAAAVIGLALAILVLITGGFWLRAQLRRQITTARQGQNQAERQIQQRRLAKAAQLVQRAEKHRPIVGAKFGMSQDFFEDASQTLDDLQSSNDSAVAVQLAIARLQLALAKIDLRLNHSSSAVKRATDASRILDRHSPPDARFQDDRIRAYRTLGHIHWIRGELDRAGDALDVAHHLHELLRPVERNTPERQLEQAKVQFWRGELLSAQGVEEASRQSHEEALRNRRRLAEQTPNDPVRQLDYAESLYARQLALSRQGKPNEALQAVIECRQIFQHLVDRAEDNEPGKLDRERDLSNCIMQQGLLLRQLGEENRQQAAACFDQALSTARQHAENFPNDALWRRHWFACRRVKADLLIHWKNLEEALTGNLKINQQMYGLIAELSDEDPDNVEWRRLRASYQRNNGLWWAGLAVLGNSAQESFSRANECFEESRRIMEDLASKHPTDVRWPKGLAQTHTLIAECLRAQGRFQQARVHESAREETLLELSQTMRKQLPQDVHWRSQSAQSHYHLGFLIYEMAIEFEAAENKQSLQNARKSLDEARKLYQMLSEEQPSQRQWLSGLVNVYDCIELVETGLNETDKAKKAIERAAHFGNRLGKLPPTAQPHRVPPEKIASVGVAAYRLVASQQNIVLSRKQLELWEETYQDQPTSERANGLAKAHRSLAHYYWATPLQEIRSQSLPVLEEGKDFLLQRKATHGLSEQLQQLLKEFESLIKMRRAAGLGANGVPTQ